MNPIIIFKTVNGYVLYEGATDGPMDPTKIHIATHISDSYRSGAVQVIDILKDHFEPKDKE